MGKFIGWFSPITCCHARHRFSELAASHALFPWGKFGKAFNYTRHGFRGAVLHRNILGAVPNRKA